MVGDRGSYPEGDEDGVQVEVVEAELVMVIEGNISQLLNAREMNRTCIRVAQWKDEDGIVVIYQMNKDIMCHYNKLDNFPESSSNRE